MIQWMIAGEVDALFGLLAIGVGLVLGGYTMMTKDAHLRPYFVVGAMSMVVFYPFLNRAKDQHETNQLEFEIMEKAYEQLGTNPKHLGAQFKVARTLQSKGHILEAVTLLRKATEGMERRLIEPEMRTLRQWETELAMRPPDTRKSVVCPFCNRTTPMDQFFCAVCGRPVWYPIAKSAAFAPNVTSKLLMIWTGAMMGLIGIPIVATTFPPNLRLAGIVGILMLFTLTAWLAFRRR
ncbi:MAG: hypothetical protein ABL949_15125 [Fimbriimonadaceae bacterium]